MQTQELQAWLEAFRTPAFLERSGSVFLCNSACSALRIREGAALGEFLSLCVSQEDAEETLCTVAGQQMYTRISELEAGRLYVLREAGCAVSANVLAHTAKNLRSTLQQMFSALDSLDAVLPEEEPTVDGTVASLLQGVFRISRVADNLEYLQRLESGEYEGCFARIDLTAELTALVGKAKDLLRLAEIRLNAQLPERTFVGTVDRKLLSLAFWNLVSNAAQHADGGTVTIQAERVHLSRLRLKVTDSGNGIQTRQQPDLMQRYQVPLGETGGQTGVGLGLSLVRHVAQLHGGSMAVSMEPGGATTVALVLDTSRQGSVSLRQEVLIFEKSLDEGLVGLADVLPQKTFDRRDLLG